MTTRERAMKAFKESHLDKSNPMHWHIWKRAYDIAYSEAIRSKDEELSNIIEKTKYEYDNNLNEENVSQFERLLNLCKYYND